MNPIQQKLTISIAAVLMLCLLVSGYFAVAAPPASEEAPLITQSYLDAVATPKAIQEAQAADGSQSNALSARINAISKQIDEKITAAAAALASDETFLKRVAAAGGGTAADNGAWKALTLTAGQKVYLAVGSQVVLRSGAASCFESGDKGLVNLSEVGELSEGQSLSLYALYTAATQSSGFQASERTKVLISGDYSLG